MEVEQDACRRAGSAILGVYDDRIAGGTERSATGGAGAQGGGRPVCVQSLREPGALTIRVAGQGRDPDRAHTARGGGGAHGGRVGAADGGGRGMPGDGGARARQRAGGTGDGGERGIAGAAAERARAANGAGGRDGGRRLPGDGSGRAGAADFPLVGGGAK